LKEELKVASSFSIRSYIDTLKSFFMYITENNEDAFDLTSAFRKISIKTEHKVKNAFTFDEMERIEKALKDELNKILIFSKYRNYLMLFFLLKTGMRGFELINLKTDDIMLEGDLYKIKIKGKGNKERVNFIRADEVKTYLDKYIALRLDIPGNYLFPNKKGVPISRFTLYTFNTRFLNRLHINKTGLHIYRHSFARKMVAKKENLATISQWLGHSDITITHNYYARASEEDLKNMINTTF
jgi:integrase/recombinase XerD